MRKQVSINNINSASVDGKWENAEFSFLPFPSSHSHSHSHEASLALSIPMGIPWDLWNPWDSWDSSLVGMSYVLLLFFDTQTPISQTAARRTAKNT